MGGMLSNKSVFLVLCSRAYLPFSPCQAAQAGTVRSVRLRPLRTPHVRAEQSSADELTSLLSSPLDRPARAAVSRLLPHRTEKRVTRTGQEHTEQENIPDVLQQNTRKRYGVTTQGAPVPP